MAGETPAATPATPAPAATPSAPAAPAAPATPETPATPDVKAAEGNNPAAADAPAEGDKSKETPAAEGAEQKSDDADPAQGGESSDTDKAKEPDQSSDGEKPDDSKKDGEGEAEEGPKAQDYQQQMKLPEGMELDQTAFEAAVPVLQKHKVPPEAMTELGPIVGDMVSRAVKQMTDTHQAKVTGWYDQTVKVHGAEGEEKFAEKQGIAQSAINAFFSEEDRATIREYGMGNLPGLFDMAYQIGLQMKEDGSGISPSSGGRKEETLAEVWYPDANK